MNELENNDVTPMSAPEGSDEMGAARSEEVEIATEEGLANDGAGVAEAADLDTVDEEVLEEDDDSAEEETE